MAAEPCWRVYYVGGPSDSPDEIICLTSSLEREKNRHT